MLNFEKHAHWARIAAVLLTGALLAIPLILLIPKLGMLTALLILPVKSLMEAGWISASIASSTFTGISFVGISIINYATTLACGLAFAFAAPILTALNNLVDCYVDPKSALEFIPSDYGVKGFFSDVIYACQDLYSGLKHLCGFDRSRVEPDGPFRAIDKESSSSLAVYRSSPTLTWSTSSSFASSEEAPSSLKGALHGQEERRSSKSFQP